MLAGSKIFCFWMKVVVGIFGIRVFKSGMVVVYVGCSCKEVCSSKCVLLFYKHVLPLEPLFWHACCSCLCVCWYHFVSHEQFYATWLSDHKYYSSDDNVICLFMSERDPAKRPKSGQCITLHECTNTAGRCTLKTLCCVCVCVCVCALSSCSTDLCLNSRNI